MGRCCWGATVAGEPADRVPVPSPMSARHAYLFHRYAAVISYCRQARSGVLVVQPRAAGSSAGGLRSFTRRESRGRGKHVMSVRAPSAGTPAGVAAKRAPPRRSHPSQSPGRFDCRHRTPTRLERSLCFAEPLPVSRPWVSLPSGRQLVQVRIQRQVPTTVPAPTRRPRQRPQPRRRPQVRPSAPRPPRMPRHTVASHSPRARRYPPRRAARQ